MMTSTQFAEQINRLINIALGSGLTVTTINAALNQAVTLLTAVAPVPTHDRTIQDPGSALNPSQP
jgi:hypothetical protein